MRKHLYLVGMPGAGKSQLGRALAFGLDLPFIDMDVWIEEHQGRTISEIFAQEGEEGFRRWEQQALSQIAALPRHIVATGGGIVLKSENRQVMCDTGYVLWIDRPLERIAENVALAHRPLLAGDTPTRLAALFAQREALYRGTSNGRIVNQGEWSTVIEAGMLLARENDF